LPACSLPQSWRPVWRQPGDARRPETIIGLLRMIDLLQITNDPAFARQL
jgi:hypothetical protein